MTRISIITPCRNAERFIVETIESVINQKAVRSGMVDLEYIVCDGSSNDRTIELVKSFGHPSIRLISEPDSGMYEALAKGIAKATGDWTAYLNAGDAYPSYAFNVLLDVAATHDVKWITGITTAYNEPGQLVHFMMPYRYRRALIRAGQYARRRPLFLPFIQQESTFWHSSLNGLVDLERLSSFRYAGDAFLWYSFAAGHQLRIVGAQIGGFRVHRGQLSENRAEYLEEIERFADGIRFIDIPLAILDNLIWYAPFRVKKWLNRNGVYLYDHRAQAWY
jgi:glycosyltransferase involved in cell wall biosynthesis